MTNTKQRQLRQVRDRTEIGTETGQRQEIDMTETETEQRQNRSEDRDDTERERGSTEAR